MNILFFIYWNALYRCTAIPILGINNRLFNKVQLVNMIAIVTVKPVSRFMNIDTFHCINTERILFHDHISSGTGQSNILLIVISHYTGPINTIWHWPDRQHRDNFRQDNATTTSSYERRCRYHRQTGQYCQAYVVTLFLSRKYLSYLTIVYIGLVSQIGTF